MAFIKETIKLASKKSCLVPTGISIAMSENYEIQIIICFHFQVFNKKISID